jgi:hypothetical protein
MNPTRGTLARILTCAICCSFVLSLCAAAQIEDAADQPAVARDDSELLLRTLEELAELKELVRQLQESLELFMDSTAYELQEENRRLRRAVKLRYREEAGGLPTVPMPDRDLLDQILELGSVPSPALKAPPQEFSYTVVDEFGRTPEAAARVGGNATSLKGMIVVVPGWSSDEQLIAMGRELRQKFNDYDNINIEVFNNLETAHRYMETYVADPVHRVMNISRFREQGRDTILLIKGNTVREIPIEPNADAVDLSQ